MGGGQTLIDFFCTLAHNDLAKIIMSNQQISDLFNQMADIMEILGEDRFRINTYRKVARVVHDCSQDVAELAAEDKLKELPGVGKSSAEKINEFVHTGTISAHEELLKQIPVNLPDLLRIPGFGPKGVAAVWKKLGVTSLGELQQVIDDHSLEALPGFGAKKAQALAHGIKFLESTRGRVLLTQAVASADAVVGRLRQKVPALKRIELCGSLRRCCETIGDVDLLAQADGEELAKEIIEAFTHLKGVKEIIAAGETKASIRFADKNVSSEEVQVDLRVVPEESMGAAWQYFTGSKHHNVRLREIAIKKKLKLNEYGLFRGEKQVAGANEAEIYKKLGMVYIPPTMREDRGEVELAQANKLPAVVQLADIQGDLHMHSPASDGRSTLEDLIAAAQMRGYKYIAITDHSVSSAIANGLDSKRLLKHAENIKVLNEQYDDFTIMAASEVDIRMDGSLDYPDEVLEELDYVTASIHSGLTGELEKNTNRLLRAMENPYVNCLSHPTGRMLGVREPMQLDMNAIIAKAVETHTALEINAHPLRLDLNDLHVRAALEGGAKLFINTDAHDVTGLKLMQYGVATAQRGWARKSDVLNCQPITTVKKWIKQKRDNLP